MRLPTKCFVKSPPTLLQIIKLTQTKIYMYKEKHMIIRLKSVKVQGVSILLFRVMNKNNDQHKFASTCHSSLALFLIGQHWLYKISTAFQININVGLTFTVTYFQWRYHLPFQTHQFHQLSWSYCKKTLQKKKTISGNDIEPLIFIFSLWWYMYIKNWLSQNWIIPKRLYFQVKQVQITWQSVYGEH